MPLRFTVEASDRDCDARAGRLVTDHGEVETPVFMPVGTQAAVRALVPEQLHATGARIVLANTYHLALRPGQGIVEKAGGLHAFMGWDGPILTDSGGFQVFSLPGAEVRTDGVLFKSEVDGREILLTPERSIEIQHALGADIIMAFDECTPWPASRKLAARGVQNSIRWLERAVAAHADGSQALFGIVQGSVYPDLRRACADAVVAFDLPGYAIGGVSVGEGQSEMAKVVAAVAPALPWDRPRYVMGVGLPDDLLAAVELGIDMFDCVIPTRYARSATLFTRRGRIRINQRRYRRDFYPIDTSCSCYACRDFTRAYLHHLYAANEITGTILGAIHNVAFYTGLLADAREAILAGAYREFRRAFLDAYSVSGAASGQKNAPRPPSRAPSR